MTKLTMAWAITWHMVVYGVMLGIACGAIYGPISMLLLYTAEVSNGRYTISDFPTANAVIYCIVAVFVAAGLGGVFGFIGGTISGVILILGLLLRKGHFFEANLYRNVIVGLCIVSVSISILQPMSQAVSGPDWFFNGPSVGIGFAMFTLAIIPTIISATATWWATKRVLTWWEKSGSEYIS